MDHFEDWQAMRMFYIGEQPRTARHLNYLPAWDVTVICKEPDGEVPRKPPACDAEQRGHWPAEAEKMARFEDVRQYVYRDRHIDRRFHIEYPHATKDRPREQGAFITETDREWDAFVAARDHRLAEAGLTPGSPQAQVARRLAEMWRFEDFDKRPLLTKFGEGPRTINHPLDALLHKSWCVGASHAFVALCDSLAMPSRGIGSQGHRTAEVFADGRWRFAENSMRHGGPEWEGHDCLMDASYMELVLDPWGEHNGAKLSEGYRASLWWRVSGWYHFVFGTWSGPHAMLFTAQNMAALYPDAPRYGIKTFEPQRLRILNRSCSGFCWTAAHGYPQEHYPCHRFRPGERLRESIWLDATEDLLAVELLITFDTSSREDDYSESAGDGLVLHIGDFRRSLRQLGAWPPRPGKEMTAYPVYAKRPCVVAKLPAELFRPHNLTWLELLHEGRHPFHMPCAPAVMEPYIAPLWSETEDRYGPTLPEGTAWA